MKPETLYYDSKALSSEIWYLNNKLHREDGPSLIRYYESGSILRECWSLSGQWHREEGPACIEYNKSGVIIYKSYYFNGIEFKGIDNDSSWVKKVESLKIEEVKFFDANLAVM